MTFLQKCSKSQNNRRLQRICSEEAEDCSIGRKSGHPPPFYVVYKVYPIYFYVDRKKCFQAFS